MGHRPVWVRVDVDRAVAHGVKPEYRLFGPVCQHPCEGGGVPGPDWHLQPLDLILEGRVNVSWQPPLAPVNLWVDPGRSLRHSRQLRSTGHNCSTPLRRRAVRTSPMDRIAASSGLVNLIPYAF